jgi:protein SCO1/2
MRLAPGYAMYDQSGGSFTSETVRGSITLYAFSSLDCGQACDDVAETMAAVSREVTGDIDFDGAEFRLVTIVADPDTAPDDLAKAAAAAAPSATNWSWISADRETLETTIGPGFRRYVEYDNRDEVRFDPGFVIVDGNGVVRGDYRYQTLADDADKLVRHLDILATELRYANGPAGAAYEAAHLFLCYP